MKNLNPTFYHFLSISILLINFIPPHWSLWLSGELCNKPDTREHVRIANFILTC